MLVTRAVLSPLPFEVVQDRVGVDLERVYPNAFLVVDETLAIRRADATVERWEIDPYPALPGDVLVAQNVSCDVTDVDSLRDLMAVRLPAFRVTAHGSVVHVILGFPRRVGTFALADELLSERWRDIATIPPTATSALRAVVGIAIDGFWTTPHVFFPAPRLVDLSSSPPLLLVDLWASTYRDGYGSL